MSYKTLSSDKVSTIVNRMGIYMPTQELEAFVNTMDDVAGANKDEVEELVVRAENSALSAQQEADTAFASAQVAANSANKAEENADLAEQARLLGAPVGFATKAELDSNLAYAEGALALVTNDPVPANNGTYRKLGSSGSGSWALSADRVTGLEQNALAWTHPSWGAADLIADSFIGHETGNVFVSAGYRRTDYIPVVEGTAYLVRSATSGAAGHAWYDEDHGYISGFGVTQSPASPVPVVAPVGAAYARFSVTEANAAIFALRTQDADIDPDRLREVLSQHMIDLPGHKVVIDAEPLPVVLDRIEASQAAILSGQNSLSNQLDIITDASSPFFVNAWEFTKSHATSTVGVNEAAVVGQTPRTLQVDAGAGVRFVANGSMVVEGSDGVVTSYAIKSVAGDVIETFEDLPAGVVRCQSMHESNNGQHLSRLGYIGLADFVVSRPQKYAYRKDAALWQYHPPICSRPTDIVARYDIWNRDLSEILVSIARLGAAASGGFVPGTTNLAKLCQQESAASNVTVNTPAKYLSRGYVLKSGAAGDGISMQIPVQRRDGFAEIVVAGVAETYTSSVDSTTKVVDCKYRVEVVGSDSTVFHDRTYDVGETRFLHVEFSGVDSLTLRITQTESKPSSIRLNGVYVYGKSPATTLAQLFNAGDVVAFLGDSWTQFPIALSGETRPLRPDGTTADGMCFLSSRIRDRAGVTVLNMGKGGTTSAWGRYWVGKIIALDPKPTHCVLSFCINDNNSGGYHTADTDSPYDFDPDDMWAFKARSAGGIKGSLNNDMWFANMRSICERLISAGIKPVVLMPPHTGSGSQTQALQQRFLDKIACGFRNDNEAGGGE